MALNVDCYDVEKY